MIEGIDLSASTTTTEAYKFEDEPDEIISRKMIPDPVVLNVDSPNELDEIRIGQSIALECTPGKITYLMRCAIF